MTFSAPIFVRARFMNATTGEIKEQTVFMGDFPMMTDKGTFIINGTERVVVSQLVRVARRHLPAGRAVPPAEPGQAPARHRHHPPLPRRVDRVRRRAEARQGRHRRHPRRPQAPPRPLRPARAPSATTRRTPPASSSAFVRHFDFLEGQWEKDRDLAPTQDEALVEIYKRARPGEPPSVESAEAYFRNAFFETRRYDLSRVGRYKLEPQARPRARQARASCSASTDAATAPTPDQPVLSRVRGPRRRARYLLHLVNGEPGYRLDDQDHFANRRIRSVGELIQNQVRIGLSRMERVVRERMTTQDVEAITPQTLINIRPVVAAIKEFFGTSQLSPVHGPGEPAVGPHPPPPPLGARPGWPVAVSGPASRSATSTSATTAACARSRRRRARTSASSAPCRPSPGSTSSASSSRRTARSSTAGSPTRSCTSPPTRRRSTSSPRPTRRSNDDGTFKRGPGPRAALAAGGLAGRPQAPARARRLLRRHHRDRLRAAGRGPAHGRLAEADRLGGHRAHPVPRARRRQPRAHGRQHAAAGRAAGAGRGPVHRHRRRGPRRPRRGRHDHRRRTTATVTEVDGDLDHRRVQDGRAARSTGCSSSERSNQDTCINQKPARRRGRQGEEGRHPRRRPLHRQRRAGARQEPARRLHAVGGLQLRGRHHPLASGW